MPQDTQAVAPLRCYSRRPEDARIDWRQAAAQVHRLVRASTRPFDGAFTRDDDGRELRIWKARVADPGTAFCAVPGQIIDAAEAASPLIACGSGALQILEASFDDDREADCLAALMRSTRRRLQ